MKGREVRFQGFKIYEGWKYEFGGTGVVIAETKTAYKIRTSIFNCVWVEKSKIEEIN